MHLLFLLHIFYYKLYIQANRSSTYRQSSGFIWKVSPVTVLEKVSVSVTLVQTLHLCFLYCLEPTYLPKGYNLAFTK